MKNIILIITGILCFNLAVAQKKKRGTDGSGVVKYTLISDNEDFNFFGGGFGIGFGPSGFNTNFGINGGLYGHFGKIDISAWGNRATSGLLAGNNSSSDDGVSAYNITASNNIELNASYAIKSTTENQEFKVVVKASGNSQIKILYYIPVPAREKTTIMADLGFNKGITYFKGEGMTYKGVMEGSSSVETIKTRTETMMAYSILNFGVSRAKCARVQINTAEYGPKEVIYYKKLYGRISYLISHELDDVLYPGPYISNDNTYMYYKYNLQKNTEMSKIGFNLGVSMYTPHKTRSYYFAEAGLMPGPSGPVFSKFYANVGFGLFISKLFN